MKTDEIYNRITHHKSRAMKSMKRSTVSGFKKVVRIIKEIEIKFPQQASYRHSNDKIYHLEAPGNDFYNFIN